MAGLRKNKTLFEAVPALGAISAHGAGKAKMMPVGFDHPGFVLLEGVNRIGRDPAQNPHVILSSHVSRCHCEVTLSQGKIRVRDLNSHNGTYVNDVRVSGEQEAKPGDKIGVSRRVTFVLVMDTDLVKPIGVEVNMGGESEAEATIEGLSPQDLAKAREEAAAIRRVDTPVLDPSTIGAVSPGVDPPTLVSPTPVPEPVPEQRPALEQRRTGRAPAVSRPAAPGTPKLAPDATGRGDDDDPDAEQQIKQLEQQRNVLATLYQITLHCLATESHKEAEKLLTNVLQRLVPMDAGFILYQIGSTWRASICPSTTQRPADATVRTSYRMARESKGPLVIRDPQQLKTLGLKQGSALVVPMLFNEVVSGVVGAISSDPQAYTSEMVDIVAQVATVAGAALRER
jgi:hypothetical protein